MEAFARHGSITERAHLLEALTDEQQTELRSLHRKYLQQFGFRFVISSGGLDAKTVLSQLRKRLNYDLYDEITVAGEQQRQITRRRLGALLDILGEKQADVGRPAEVGGGLSAIREEILGLSDLDWEIDSQYIKARGSSTQAKSEKTKKSA
jgi:hypothetical protein